MTWGLTFNPLHFSRTEGQGLDEMFTDAIDALKAAASAYAADLDAAQSDFAEVDSIFRAWDMAACVEAIRLDTPLTRRDLSRVDRLNAAWMRTVARIESAATWQESEVHYGRAARLWGLLSTEKLAETLVRLDV